MSDVTIMLSVDPRHLTPKFGRLLDQPATLRRPEDMTEPRNFVCFLCDAPARRRRSIDLVCSCKYSSSGASAYPSRP